MDVIFLRVSKTFSTQVLAGFAVFSFFSFEINISIKRNLYSTLFFHLNLFFHEQPVNERLCSSQWNGI